MPLLIARSIECDQIRRALGQANLCAKLESHRGYPVSFAILWSECRRHTALIYENWNPKGAYEEPFLKAPECSWILVPIYVVSIHIGSKNNTSTQEAGSSGLHSITCSEASEVQASYTVDLLKVTSCLGCNSLNTFGLYLKFLCHGSSSFDIFNISCPQS